MTTRGVPTLRAQLAEARRLGLVVQPIRRTGEVRVIDVCCGGSSVRVNNRRKDGTREVGHLVARHLDIASVATDPPPPTCSEDCAWCDRHPYVPHVTVRRF